jgi:mitotic-spindle organizing protein 1
VLGKTTGALRVSYFGDVVVYEMSNLLNTGLDRETLGICMQLLEEGANPEALAALIAELNKEASRF